MGVEPITDAQKKRKKTYSPAHRTFWSNHRRLVCALPGPRHPILLRCHWRAPSLPPSAFVLPRCRAAVPALPAGPRRCARRSRARAEKLVWPRMKTGEHSGNHDSPKTCLVARMGRRRYRSMSPLLRMPSFPKCATSKVRHSCSVLNTTYYAQRIMRA